MERSSIAELVTDFLAHGTECAYMQRRGYRSERWSYSQLAGAAFQCARKLESREINKGDHILLWAPNSAEWVALFFGCVLRGVVVVPVDDASSPDFVDRICSQVRAKLVVCSRSHAPRVANTPVLVLEELPVSLAPYSAAPYPAVPIARTDPLQIIFTSGTTAEPRGVVISHGNVLANLLPFESEIQQYLRYERWVHPIRFLNLLPLSHVFGQFLGMFLPPLLAGMVIFQNSLNPSEVIDTVRRERVSALVAVPRMLHSLREKIMRDLESARDSADFHSRFQASEGKHFLSRWWTFRRIHRQFGWKFWAFVSGGAALDQQTEQFWGRLGFAVIQGYGLTETTSLISVNHPFRLGRGSIGKVLPGREVMLAKDGEILVRGGGVATAYLSSGQLQPVTDHDGWYRTGDIGALDAEGNLYFKGRKKEVIVTSAGMNIYPEDLEAALCRQPDVRDCAIVALDRDGNAEPCAVLILRDSALAADVVRRANESLSEYQHMRQWFVWPEKDFPRTPTQKQRSNLIRDVVHARMAARPESLSAAGPLAELMTRVTGRPMHLLHPDAKLDDDLRLSSLERVELLGALEDRYQMDLSEAGFSATRTIADLEKLLAGGTESRAVYHYPSWTLGRPVTWIRFLAYYLLVRPAIRLLGWPRIEGRENLRGVNGPVLVISNHLDDVDVGFIQTALPARLRHRLATAAGGEALEALRTPLKERWLPGRMYDRVKWALGVALLNLFPLPREAAFRKSFAYAGECVDRGYSVLVFPEGRHTTDGKLLPFRLGIGLLANQLRIPVVPMRIDGLFAVKQSGRKFASPGKIRVRIGKPVEFPPDLDPRSITEDLQKRVENL